ncbi:MAG: 5-formyltetrahydrofolate cyclo-ligase [Chloroflexi bacterium]|nr:5-formyltetrahydrofolate cyclo-ligase [Chloroflexota bacterium]
MDRNQIRQSVWTELIKVAKPDSRFHLDFNDFIPDFEGSEHAVANLMALPEYQSSKVLFVTPDNCLDLMRAENVRQGKVQMVTTYGIKRGFIEIKPEYVPEGIEDFAMLLDAMERVGKPITLREISSKYRFDLLITGASAINLSGTRFGKGHGYFDMEWAMLNDIGVVTRDTPIVGVIHDVQLMDLDLPASPHDVVCDIIVTPTRTIRVPNVAKPAAGVIWESVTAETMAAMPVLYELKEILSGSSLG